MIGDCILVVDYEGQFGLERFARGKFDNAFLVFEFARKVFVIGVPVPRLNANERCAALRGSPEAPVRKTFGANSQRLRTFARTNGDFIRFYGESLYRDE